MNNQLNFKVLSLTFALSCFFGGVGVAHAEMYNHGAKATATPIEHVIVVVGENHSFDNLFGAYQPQSGQKIDNLLSKGIINADGSPGAHFDLAKQKIGVDTDTYKVVTESDGDYSVLPQPYTTYALGQTGGISGCSLPYELAGWPIPNQRLRAL